MVISRQLNLPESIQYCITYNYVDQFVLTLQIAQLSVSGVARNLRGQAIVMRACVCCNF